MIHCNYCNCHNQYIVIETELPVRRGEGPDFEAFEDRDTVPGPGFACFLITIIITMIVTIIISTTYKECEIHIAVNIQSGSPTNLLLSSQMGTLSMNISPSGQIMLISEARRTTRRALKQFCQLPHFLAFFVSTFFRGGI